MWNDGTDFWFSPLFEAQSVSDITLKATTETYSNSTCSIDVASIY